MNRIVGLLLLATLLLFAGCVHNGAGTKTQASSAVNVEYRGISAQQLKTMLNQDENIFLMDVHVPVQKHIPSTDYNVNPLLDFFRYFIEQSLM
ncbi:hypothetical protein BMS3Bbin15_01205 [archaeon BMS3Bbin15]|nr:hypothetical protein BMS3Bbin15_01205 [archaeon BMS3Bbin15]